MNTNYSNNYHQSFGSFKFSVDAKNVIKARLRTNAKLAKLEKILNLENSGIRADRKIYISALPNLAGHYELRCQYKGHEFDENMFSTPLSFLKKAIRRADAIDKRYDGHIAAKIDKLI